MFTKILVISYYSPCRGHAGGLRQLDLFRKLKQINTNISIDLVTCKNSIMDWGLEDLTLIFDKIIWLENNQYNIEYIQDKIIFEDYQVIDLHFFKSGRLIKHLKRHYPNILVIYSPMESQLRGACISLINIFKHWSGKNLILSIILACHEVYYVLMSDRVSCVSKSDSKFVSWLKAKNDVFSIETAVSELGLSNDFYSLLTLNEFMRRPNRLIFFAYFGAKPNYEALKWFCNYVHPLIVTVIKDYKLCLIGRNLDDKIVNISNYTNIEYVGEVDTIAEITKFGSIGIAPAIWGAGIRGKVHQYAILSMPCVASLLGVDSLKYQNDESIVLAEMAREFADGCIKLLQDRELAYTMGVCAKEVCLKNYTWDAQVGNLKKLYQI